MFLLVLGGNSAVPSRSQEVCLLPNQRRCISTHHVTSADVGDRAISYEVCIYSLLYSSTVSLGWYRLEKREIALWSTGKKQDGQAYVDSFDA